MKSVTHLALLAALAAHPAQAAVPDVVTDIAPVHALVSLVMGDLGTPELLVSGGGEPHSYQLRPSQARNLANARLIFWIGPEMTPWLGHSLDSADGATVMGLLALPGTKVRDFDDTGAEGAATDPHAWLDPGNAAVWVAGIADALAEADPEHAETYHANAAQAEKQLQALAAELETTLAPAAEAPIIVGHDALGYFADRFHLNVVAAVAAGDAAEPGAAHLSDIAHLLADHKAVCLFPEAGQDPTRATQLIAGTTTRLGAPLDAEGVTLTPGPDLYAALLRGLAAAISDCTKNAGE